MSKEGTDSRGDLCIARYQVLLFIFFLFFFLSGLRFLFSIHPLLTISKAVSRSISLLWRDGVVCGLACVFFFFFLNKITGKGVEVDE